MRCVKKFLYEIFLRKQLAVFPGDPAIGGALVASPVDSSSSSGPYGNIKSMKAWLTN
jgi:hypothetical protein